MMRTTSRWGKLSALLAIPILLCAAFGKAQDLLCDQLKRNGYLVLATSDPLRPLAWIAEGSNPAD
jgi:hypothetical protein